MRLFSVSTAVCASLAAATSLAACGSADSDAAGVSERTACGTVVRRDDGAPETERYGRDERGRLLDAETRDADGNLVRRRSWTWDGKLLIAAEVAEGDRVSRTTYDHDFDRVLRITHEGADGTGYVTTYGYAGGAMVTQDIEARGPGLEHRHATIEGADTGRTTIVDCTVAAPRRCATWVFEQPDRVAEHWTVATLDRDTDGAIDRRFERTLDAAGRELAFTETALDAQGAPQVVAREITTRDLDGAALGYVREVTDGPGRGMTQVVSELSCARRGDDAGAELTPATARPAAPDLDDASLATRLLRRELGAPSRAPRPEPHRACTLLGTLFPG